MEILEERIVPVAWWIPGMRAFNGLLLLLWVGIVLAHFTQAWSARSGFGAWESSIRQIAMRICWTNLPCLEIFDDADPGSNIEIALHRQLAGAPALSDQMSEPGREFPPGQSSQDVLPVS